MAGDWIKFETATSDKPEVWAIASLLSIDPDAVVGKLLRVWAWFDQHTEKGNAPSVTKMLLDRNVGVTGFCDAVISSGWMTEKNGSIELSNFDRHNGKTAKSRVLTAKRVAQHKINANGKGNAGSVSDALPREDKIREDINTIDTNVSIVGTIVPPCPHLEIIELYNRILPELQQVVPDRWGGARSVALKTRWRESKKHQSLRFWERFFTELRNHPFYMGQNDRGWSADFGWIIKRENFDKLIERFTSETHSRRDAA